MTVSTEPLTEEQAIQSVLFDLMWKRGNIPPAIEGSENRADDLRAYIEQRIDGLGRALVLIERYRKLRAALAVLREE